MDIAVLGAGTWGSALARLLTKNGHVVTLWSAFREELTAIAKTHRHPHLGEAEMPEALRVCASLKETVYEKNMVVFAVPSPYVRLTAEKAAPYLSSGQILVNVAKGIENTTDLLLSDVIQDVLTKQRPSESFDLVALSGPTHAEEVAQDLPSAIVSASEEEFAAQCVQDAFMNEQFRVYTNRDIQGVELCGALKNVIALAAGISDGLGFGDNAKAAIITRGMAEMTRLGLAMGCFPETFAGLAGYGDLIVTATSVHSRNHRCGERIGQGLSPKQAVREVGQVVEGMNALPAARSLAARYDVDMPIADAVDAILGGADVRSTVFSLMTREKKTECRSISV